MEDLIATEAYAQSIGGGTTLYTPNLGCTKSRAIALGCEVSGTYTDKQLVCQKDLSKTSTVTYSVRNRSLDYLTNVTIVAGNCRFAGDFAPKAVLYSTGVPSGNSWSIVINGSVSSDYMVYPTPNSTIYSYLFQKKDYVYEISLNPYADAITGSYTRVFILSNMDQSLVGTRNTISSQGISSHYTIYTNTNSSGTIGQFIGNQCTNQGGPLDMVNGNTYSILYTVIDTSVNTNQYPAGAIIRAWRRVYEFKFDSNKYYDSFNIAL